jgi:hypothetical protein
MTDAAQLPVVEQAALPSTQNSFSLTADIALGWKSVGGGWLITATVGDAIGEACTVGVGPVTPGSVMAR